MRVLLILLLSTIAPALLANSVKLCCWIIGNNDCATGFNASDVTDLEGTATVNLKKIYALCLSAFVLVPLRASARKRKHRGWRVWGEGGRKGKPHLTSMD